MACWLFATQKDGVSAQSLQRTLEIGSYQTAWAMLHRLRSALVRPGRERLAGRVEVDETLIGGEEPGLRGGRRRTGLGEPPNLGKASEVDTPNAVSQGVLIVTSARSGGFDVDVATFYPQRGPGVVVVDGRRPRRNGAGGFE